MPLVTRRTLIATTTLATTGLATKAKAGSWWWGKKGEAAKPPNVIVFTLDDCDAHSLGCFGSALRGVTPNLDALAADGARFEHAYTVSATCQPSRLALMSGLYMQSSGAVGHDQPLPNDTPTLSSILADAGYFTAIMGKQGHYKPREAFRWTRDRSSDGVKYLTADSWDQDTVYWTMGRSPLGHYRGCKELIGEARAQGRPFFLHINTGDPHRPWPGSADEVDIVKLLYKDAPIPIRPYEKNYSPIEVPVPGYLPDLPGVRVDLAQYNSALHNGDKAFGAVMTALKESGQYDNTITVCLSDQGASFPLSKQAVYHYGLNLGLIMRMPGLTQPGTVIGGHMIQIIDIMPTLLDVLGLGDKIKCDGKSFLPLLKGEAMRMRDKAFASYNYARHGLQVFPMRTVFTKDYQYIFNAWYGAKNSNNRPIVYDGRIDPLAGQCWTAMKTAAANDTELKKRVNFIRLRTREEFYDLSSDPYCRTNQIDNAAYSAQLADLRTSLDRRLEQYNDPLLPSFRGTGAIPPEWMILAQPTHVPTAGQAP